MKEKAKPTKEIQPHGGARAGSGRKPKTDYSIREIFKAAFDAVYTFEDWQKFILKAKGDPKLEMYIIDQRMGKAPQSIKLGNEDGNPFEIVVVSAKK